MQSLFENYIQSISSKFTHEETSEMGYRTDFEILIKGIFESIKVRRIDHDAKANQGNKPDFAVIKNDIPILYIEAKDIGVSLDKIEKSEQMSRYYGYANLVLTDYVEFRFYRNGLSYEDPIKIADYDIKNRTLTPIPANYEYLAKTLVDFTQSFKEPIKSANHLAKIMGGKGQRLRDNVRHLFEIKSENNGDLEKLYKTIKELLVSDLTRHSFADMYAQTLVYGLFVARFYDKTLDSFTRQEARELIPNSNRFLKRFFDHIVGDEFKSSLRYIVDELCEVFSHANVAELMKDYFKKGSEETNKGKDPVIHFYEDFLKEYDSELRKKMGAYYTPLPVVKFIVHSVDHLLKRGFGLASGLADTSKTKDGIHKVQILDPAVGTGTFLSEAIATIYKNFLGQEGRWPGYVHNDLLPRLHGFELMMTPYTIAHLKLGLEFRLTGFWDFHRRLGIYLTNSLEESPKQEQMFAFGLAESIAEESKEAANIKDKKPIMVVLGNPPYSVSSSNKGEWILNLIKDYKKNLNERKINLDDDYIKFIRLAEHFIEKNKTGIVAMITNNSYIDGVTHRQMRKHLLETFNEIYILDLHGNSKKKEKSPDGGKDENVFDIQQGVSISIFVRRANEKKGLGNVHHAEFYGKQENKFKMLDENDIKTIKWKQLNYSEPYYFFVPKDFGEVEEYEKGFKVDEIFLKNAMGIVTGIDDLSIFHTKEDLRVVTDSILNSTNPYDEFHIKDGRKYKKEQRINELRGASLNPPVEISYRPFDTRYIYYTEKSECWINSPRIDIMSNFIKGDNLGFCAVRLGRNPDYHNYYVTNNITDKSIISSLDNANVFPLYLYAEDGSKSLNLKDEFVEKFKEVIGDVSPEDIFHYIYAVLYSPKYRKRYNEFLKIDFPRVPYPKDVKTFKKLVKFGSELRSLHLLESSKVNKFITTYPITGSDMVEKPIYKDGNVYVNNSQYFGKVPEVAWNFYIGGYQPAQKWLKDRKNRTLTNEDIEHYQKIIISLTETERIMKEIDEN